MRLNDEHPLTCSSCAPATQRARSWRRFFSIAPGKENSAPSAAGWFQVAADRGHADAQRFLGTMYEAGQGVRQDHVIAHQWLNLAAAAGNKEAATIRDSVAAKI
jgi:TPR repeat protein